MPAGMRAVEAQFGYDARVPSNIHSEDGAELFNISAIGNEKPEGVPKGIKGDNTPVIGGS
jgi:hypothetical protein